MNSISLRQDKTNKTKNGQRVNLTGTMQTATQRELGQRSEIPLSSTAIRPLEYLRSLKNHRLIHAYLGFVSAVPTLYNCKSCLSEVCLLFLLFFFLSFSFVFVLFFLCLFFSRNNSIASESCLSRGFF